MNNDIRSLNNLLFVRFTFRNHLYKVLVKAFKGLDILHYLVVMRDLSNTIKSNQEDYKEAVDERISKIAEDNDAFEKTFTGYSKSNEF